MKESRFSRDLKALGFDTYDAYLDSEHWFCKKAEYAASDLPKTCQSCGDPKYILHHMHYNNLGKENLDDFLALCNSCHHRLHLIIKEKGKWPTKRKSTLNLLGIRLPVRADYKAPAPPVLSAALASIISAIQALTRAERIIIQTELQRIGYVENAPRREAKAKRRAFKMQRRAYRRAHA